MRTNKKMKVICSISNKIMNIVKKLENKIQNNPSCVNGECKILMYDDVFFN